MTHDLLIRSADRKDLLGITKIYNQAIEAGNVTADIMPLKVKDREKWFKGFDPESYPIYIAVIDGKVVGYCYLTSWRKGREAMRNTAEISFFIDYNYHRQGIGSSLINHTIKNLKSIGKENLIAILLDVNEQSIKILKKFGFKKWGHLPGIAEFNGRKCGNLIYGLSLSK